MYIKTDEVKFNYVRKNKFNKKIKYSRKKKVHTFSCDNCGIIFSRDTFVDNKRLSNDYKHYCPDCIDKCYSSGVETKKQNMLSKIGEKYIDSSGYVVIRLPPHTNYSNVYNNPNCSYIREHHKIMQDHLERTLIKGEVVHHIDGNKQNNDITNLDLCSVKEHNLCHAKSEEIIFELYKRGLVGYNRSSKKYFLK